MDEITNVSQASLQRDLLPKTRVWHIGTFDPTAKTRGMAHGGSGLCVSLDPVAWATIAHLDTSSLYLLEKPNGQFLDYYAFIRRKGMRRLLWEWAQAHGYVTWGTRYRVRQWDGEWEETLIFTFGTQDEARQAGYTDRQIRTSQGYLPTEAMRDRAFHARLPFGFELDFAACFFVEDCLPQVDGLWWNDRDDPSRLSAPWGVIFPSRLDSWSRQYVQVPLALA